MPGNGVFPDVNQVVRLAHVTDGASRTILVGERPADPETYWGWCAAGRGLDEHGLGDYAARRALGAPGPDWLQGLHARSDAMNRYYGLGEYANPVDAREQALTAKREAQLASTPAPDWFERSANAAIRDNRGVFVADDRFDLHPQQVPTTVTATSSGRDIDVPQIGIGLGVGLLLALGLFLAMKYTRIRPVAH